jgi:hypothetical protein
MIDPVTATLALQASACQLVFDTLTHEHDIRGALSEPGSRTGDLAFEVALGFSTTMGDQFIRHAGLPALRLITPTIGSVQLGDPHTARGQYPATVSAALAWRPDKPTAPIRAWACCFRPQQCTTFPARRTTSAKGAN